MSAQRQAFEAWWLAATAHGDPLRRPHLTREAFEAGAEWQALISQQAPVSAEAGELYLCLHELTAMVKGECPSLLSEDSGGSATLALRIEDALSYQSRAQVVPAEPVAWMWTDHVGLGGSPITRYSDVSPQYIDDAVPLYLAAPAVSEPAEPGVCQRCKGVIKNCDGDDCDGLGTYQEHWGDTAPVSEPAEASVVNQSLTAAAAPSAPIEPTPPAGAADKAWRKWSLTPADDTWPATPEFKKLEAAFRAGFASAAPAEPAPEAMTNVQIDEMTTRIFGLAGLAAAAVWWLKDARAIVRAAIGGKS